ncbi:MAG: EamA family transporter [Candidatus Delongbacteria bacterium]|jgi:multidrug transporter EmrE-like cation transporter|nr:EamA family transporter [Candidatus Delongbacteria bacterium]MDD4205573.1 EamA family transporter [Candidatus Delongbacteria bacterium]
MIYLFLAIISSASIAVILKFSENRKLNRYAVTSANYVAAFTISLLMNFGIGEIQRESNLNAVVGLGVFAGLLYFLGFIFIQRSIKENGVGITGAVSKIGIILPVVLSMILWKEIPSSFQTAGVVLSIMAIVIINIDPREIKSFRNFNATIILLFFIAGSAEFTTKLFEKYFASGYKPLYLFVIFFTAFWISVYFTYSSWKKGKKITKTDIVTGLIVGVPNMFASFFLIESFRYYKASVAFPIYSSGTILLINVAGLLIFKEKLSRKNTFAIFMIVAAIVLMNIR